MIRIFVNDPRRLPGHYAQFLTNSLRREFGLEGAVIKLQFRSRTRDLTRPKPPQKPNPNKRPPKTKK